MQCHILDGSRPVTGSGRGNVSTASGPADGYTGEDNFRYLNKNLTTNERELYDMYWNELVNKYGTRVEYYTYNYSLTGHDYLYGEHPAAHYSEPHHINIMINLPNEAILLSKFGIESTTDFIGIVTVRDFQNSFGYMSEPKSQDVIRLVEAGWGTDELPAVTGNVIRQLNTMKSQLSAATFVYDVSDKTWMRYPQLYEITERDWQELSMNINTLLGHYVWVLKGKRFDYSYQPGIVPEGRQGIVSDETITGILSGGSQDINIQNPQPEKPYPDNVTNDSNNNIWDYSKGSQTRNTGAYGDY